MDKCLHRNIQCSAPYCKWINKSETVINHPIKCILHLIYCAECKTLSNIFVLNHDCKVIQANCTISFNIKYYHKNNHFITRIKMCYFEYIVSIHRSKIIVLIDISYLCSCYSGFIHFLLYSLNALFNDKLKFSIIAVGTFYLYLLLYSLGAFCNAIIKLKIYHLIIFIIIMNNLCYFINFNFFNLVISYWYSFTCCFILLCKYYIILKLL